MDAATDLQNWQEAFEKHSISTARAIEKQLRSSVANNRERLRVLVGGNYRDLLSTAEQIVTLDGQTQIVESHISQIGQQCQPPVHQRQSNNSIARKQLLATLRTLQRCTDAARLSTTNGDWLLSARLIVISRLLIKSFGDHEKLLRALPALREKTASLRRQLLRRIDITLASVHAASAAVIVASCAYCLITSASLQDVMRHVLRLRTEKLRKLLDQEHRLDRHIIGALRYYVTTSKLVGGLNGRAMTDALGNLQKRPILQEPSLLEFELMNFNGVKNLISDDIVSFTPYLKRTPFSAQEHRDVLQEWASIAFSQVSDSLQRLLQDFTSLNNVLDIRRSLSSVLLPVYFSVPGVTSMHRVMHDVLSNRIEEMYLSKLQELQKLAGNGSLFGGTEPVAGTLWQGDLATMSLRDGAPTFLQHVHRRRRGTNISLARTSRALAAWISSTKAMQESLEALRHIRWRDVLEEPDDEQNAEADHVIKKLAKDDPERYTSQMKQALLAGFESLEDYIVQTVIAALDQGGSAAITIIHLRSIREFISPLREAYPEVTKFQKLDEALPRLHKTIAEAVVGRVAALTEADNDSLATRSASLENLPSPRTFGFLRRLCAILFDMGGTDIWSPRALKVLKTAVAKHVFDEERRRHYLDTKFDEAYLAAALDSTQTTLDSSDPEQKAAREYWNRTKLLFGVLSG